MKFGVQVSESNLKMLVNDFRVSFEPDKREIFGQFDRLLRTSDIHIESTLESIDLEDPLWKYLSYFTEGRGAKDFKIGSDQLERDIIDQKLNEHPRNYFFSNDETTTKLLEFPVFVGEEKSLIRDFGNVSCCPGKTRLSSISIRKQSEFANAKWKIFEKFKHPTSSILIYDPYLFSGDLRGQINERFEQTIMPLLQALVRSTEEIDEINLIGSHKYFVGRAGFSEIKEKQQKLDTYIRKVFTKAGFTSHPKITLHRKHLEHDRRMLTDYIQIKPGSSFQFLNQRGQVPVGGFTVHVAPLFHEDIQKDVNDFKRALSRELNAFM